MTHSELVQALTKPGSEIRWGLSDAQANLLHMVLGIAGEAGEMIDSVKKAAIYKQKLDTENLIEEIGDIEFYIEGLCQAIGVSREYCLQHNIKKLTKRYGERYSDQAAKDRLDKK